MCRKSQQSKRYWMKLQLSHSPADRFLMRLAILWFQEFNICLLLRWIYALLPHTLTWVPASLRDLVPSVIQIFILVLGVRLYLDMVSVCISVTINEVDHLFIYFWSLGFFPPMNFLSLLPIFTGWFVMFLLNFYILYIFCIWALLEKKKICVRICSRLSCLFLDICIST